MNIAGWCNGNIHTLSVCAARSTRASASRKVRGEVVLCVKRCFSFLLVLSLSFSLVIFSAGAADVGIYDEYSVYSGYGLVGDDMAAVKSVSRDEALESDYFFTPRWGYYDLVFSSTWGSAGTSSMGFGASYVLEDIPVSTSGTWYICVGVYGSAGVSILNNLTVDNVECAGWLSTSCAWYSPDDMYCDMVLGPYVKYEGLNPGRHFLMRIRFSDRSGAAVPNPYGAFAVGSTEDIWSLTHNAGSSWGYYVPCDFIVPDDEYSDSVNAILTHVASIDDNLIAYLPQIYSSLTSIVSELELMNTSMESILLVLDEILNWEHEIWYSLEQISVSVDAIYYVLTEALQEESSALSDAAASAVDQIENEKQATQYYQTSMQSAYDSLSLGDYSYGEFTGGIELVGKIFTDIWDAFGMATIVFTFPLILGVALMVVGRVDKSDRSSSSRGDSKDD